MSSKRTYKLEVIDSSGRVIFNMDRASTLYLIASVGFLRRNKDDIVEKLGIHPSVIDEILKYESNDNKTIVASVDQLRDDKYSTVIHRSIDTDFDNVVLVSPDGLVPYKGTVVQEGEKITFDYNGISITRAEAPRQLFEVSIGEDKTLNMLVDDNTNHKDEMEDVRKNISREVEESFKPVMTSNSNDVSILDDQLEKGGELGSEIERETIESLKLTASSNGVIPHSSRVWFTKFLGMVVKKYYNTSKQSIDSIIEDEEVKSVLKEAVKESITQMKQVNGEAILSKVDEDIDTITDKIIDKLMKDPSISEPFKYVTTSGTLEILSGLEDYKTKGETFHIYRSYVYGIRLNALTVYTFLSLYSDKIGVHVDKDVVSEITKRTNRDVEKYITPKTTRTKNIDAKKKSTSHQAELGSNEEELPLDVG